MKVLITGGAGYIGSHTAVQLLDSGHEVVIVDNLSNSSLEAVKRVERITGKSVSFYEADVRDSAKLDEIFSTHAVDAVIHFAGLKAVGESVQKPLLYYQNNLDSTLVLLDVMSKRQVKKLVFSSSATVYGAAGKLTEDMPWHPTNPYGHTKAMIEQILMDVVATQTGWSVTSLRYFNPVGAHESGLIGEDPNGVPNNLLPYVSQVAIGKRAHVSVFGDDYSTPDGTGVRDYIHVMDLAEAHLSALEHLDPAGAYKAYNIGTGKGISVLELIAAYKTASGKEIPYEITSRRAGDLDEYYADPSLAKKELQWHATRDIARACADSWNWQSKNPDGYRS